MRTYQVEVRSLTTGATLSVISHSRERAIALLRDMTRNHLRKHGLRRLTDLRARILPYDG